MAEAHGARILKEIDEGGLDELLSDLRALHSMSTNTPPIRIGIPLLDSWLFRTHTNPTNDSHRTSTLRPLQITGYDNGLPLLYHIISTSVSTPRNGTIVVLDIDGRFDITQLRCTWEDLQHVFVQRVILPQTQNDEAVSSESGEGERKSLRDVIEEIEKFMVYGEHQSLGREWIGVVICGGGGGIGVGCNVVATAGWRGWLKVENEAEDVIKFGVGMSADEAMEEREKRRDAVEGKRWRVVCNLGTYKWHD